MLAWRLRPREGQWELPTESAPAAILWVRLPYTVHYDGPSCWWRHMSAARITEQRHRPSKPKNPGKWEIVYLKPPHLGMVRSTWTDSWRETGDREEWEVKNEQEIWKSLASWHLSPGKRPWIWIKYSDECIKLPRSEATSYWNQVSVTVLLRFCALQEIQSVGFN